VRSNQQSNLQFIHSILPHTTRNTGTFNQQRPLVRWLIKWRRTKGYKWKGSIPSQGFPKTISNTVTGKHIAQLITKNISYILLVFTTIDKVLFSQQHESRDNVWFVNILSYYKVWFCSSTY